MAEDKVPMYRVKSLKHADSHAIVSPFVFWANNEDEK